MRNGTVTKANGTVVPAYDNTTRPITEAAYRAAREAGKLKDNNVDTSGTFLGIIGGTRTTIPVADVIAWNQFAANAWDFTLEGGTKGRTYDETFPGKMQ